MKVVEHRVISDPDEHMQHKADRLKQWFSRDGLEQHVKWMDDEQALASPARAESPFVRDTRHGRGLRETVLAGDDFSHLLDSVVPAEFEPVLREARAKVDASDTHARQLLDGVGGEHTTAEFIGAVRAASHASAPGGSRLSYAALTTT